MAGGDVGFGRRRGILDCVGSGDTLDLSFLRGFGYLVFEFALEVEDFVCE